MIALLLAAAFVFTNPVIHADYSDPDVCRVGNEYWMTASSFNYFPGLPILHSRDLVNWRLVGAALDSYPEPLGPGEGVWAPSIRYHDGWYYIYVGDPDRGIFMVRTQDPAGKWEEPVWVVREKGFIDPCPLWDDDGKAYLSHALAGSRAGLKSVVYVAPLSEDGTHLTGPSRIVFDGHATQPTIEGTKFYKRNGYYYIFAPAGGVSTGWQTVLRSKSPWGPYEEKVVMASADGTINGPHQGAWVETGNGHWFLHFQDKGAYGRIVHLQPMSWADDGWPVIGEDPDGDGIGQPVDRWEAPLWSSPNRLEVSYTGPYGLSLDWQYPSVPRPFWHFAMPAAFHNPPIRDVRLYSVEQGSGYRNLWDCPNLLSQKFPAERFTVMARLVFRPNPQLKERGEQAGFVVMGTSYYGLRLTDKTGGALLETVSCVDAPDGTEEDCRSLGMLSYVDGRELTLWVKLEVRAEDTGTPVPAAVCRFHYSLDGKQYTRAGEPFRAQPGRWVGARWGFFCNRFTPKNDSGSLDISDLEVREEYAPLEGFVNSEAGVPPYELPDVLGGVKTVKKWEKKRRPELLRMFEHEMYGPVPESVPDIDLVLHVPEGVDGPVPAFLGVDFFAAYWPCDTILSRGYAVAYFDGGDTANGSIAVWAKQLSKALDMLEADPRIGPVAVIGHSRMGKAALWAGAVDNRFAMVISNESGCGGAAISRRRFGETVRRINTHYPYWFSRRFHQYSDNEDMLPFDQHELLALIAPRPQYVASASEDLWSDPRGEFLGLCGAAPAYALYGLECIREADFPATGESVIRGVTGYHIRPGRHEITLEDWLHYLDFADRFLH